MRPLTDADHEIPDFTQQEFDTALQGWSNDSHDAALRRLDKLRVLARHLTPLDRRHRAIRAFQYMVNRGVHNG